MSFSLRLNACLSLFTTSFLLFALLWLLFSECERCSSVWWMTSWPFFLLRHYQQFGFCSRLWWRCCCCCSIQTLWCPPVGQKSFSEKRVLSMTPATRNQQESFWWRVKGTCVFQGCVTRPNKVTFGCRSASLCLKNDVKNCRTAFRRFRCCQTGGWRAHSVLVRNTSCFRIIHCCFFSSPSDVTTPAL